MEVVNVLRPTLPDLVIHQIIQILPTKAAVRMSCLSKQWDGVWCSAPILAFDEGDEPGKYDNDQIDLNKIIEHRNFIKIVERWQKFLEKDQRKQVLLDKFRLRMMRYVPGDYDIIDRCLSSVFERSVKELDISLRISRLYWGFSWQNRLELYYCISRTTLVNAETLIVMKLEYVRIKDLQITDPLDTRLLPNLQTMYLKKVHSDDHSLFFLIGECPSIENLSLTSCTFEFSELRVLSSSLKSLQVKHCNALIITVDEARNLECFTFSSNFSLLETITLKESFNLKYINVQAEHLKQFRVIGCHDVMKATINTPNLFGLIFQGFLKSKVSVKAANLTAADIVLWELWDGELLAFNGPWKHFLTLRNFFENIGCPKDVTIHIRNVKDIIFPEDFREKFSSPWHCVDHLFLTMPNPPSQAKDIPDFSESLTWMAPYADKVFIQSDIYSTLRYVPASLKKPE